MEWLWNTTKDNYNHYVRQNYDYYLKDRVDTTYNDAKRWLGYRQPFLFYVNKTPIDQIEEIQNLLDELGYKDIGHMEFSESNQTDFAKIISNAQSDFHYPAIYFSVADYSWMKWIGIAAFAGVTAPLVLPYCLGALGFAKAGIAANSLAATIQPILYKGTTTGVFSLLQSAGAGGLSVAGNVAVGGAASSTVVAGGKITGAVLTDEAKEQVFNPDLNMKLVIFYREGRKWDDFSTVSKYVKTNFGINTEQMDVGGNLIGIESTKEKEDDFNSLCKEERKLPIAPGGILSLQFTKEYLVNNEAWRILKALPKIPSKL